MATINLPKIGYTAKDEDEAIELDEKNKTC